MLSKLFTNMGCQHGTFSFNRIWHSYDDIERPYNELSHITLILTGQRCETVRNIDINFIQCYDEGCIITIREVLKHTKSGKHQPPLELRSYPNDKRLCIIAYLREYIKRTEGLRKEQSQLLISFNKTHKHRRTGLEIFGGQTGICPTRTKGARTSRGSRGMLPRKILKNRLSLMPFPAFWCDFLCMGQVTNEKKILRILLKQNINRKIARLLSTNCPNN